MPVYHSGNLGDTDRPHYNYPLRPNAKDLTKPLAPRNLMVTSPYTKGAIDIRWDNPKLLPQNSGLNITGCNVYRSTDTPYGPYVKMNDAPVNVLFFRDQTEEQETVQENATATLKYHEPDDRWLIYTQKKPIVMPGTNGKVSDRIQDVWVEIDDGDGIFLTMPAYSVDGFTGEIQLISQPVFNEALQQIIPPRLPKPPNGRVRVTYRTMKNFVTTVLAQRIFYKVTTIAVDPLNPNNRIETPIDEVSERSLFDIEALDYIWREAILRNRWILDQGGERVKLFLRKWMGNPCPSFEHLYGQSHNDCTTCFPAGQMVTLSDGSKKDIKDVKIDDRVIMFNGIPGRVYETKNREYKKLIYTFDIVGKDPITCTDEHPFLIISKESLCCKRHSKSISKERCIPMTKGLCHKGYNTNATDCSYRPETSWVRAKDLKIGDYLLIPRLKKEEDNFSEDEMFLFGFYTAEGCVSLNGSKVRNRVRFGFGKKEWETLSIVRETWKRQYGVDLRLATCKNSYELWYCDEIISNRFIKNCGMFAHTKKLSSEIIESSNNLLSIFLGGYLLGDGHNSKNIGKFGSLSYSTVSMNLSSQLELLCAKIGCTVNTKYIFHKDKRPGKSGWIYESSISSVSAHLIKLFGRKCFYRDIKKKQHKIIPLDDFICYPIKNITTVNFDGIVYNLEVEDTHTFLVNNLVVHNCFGTNYIGGYSGPYNVIIAPPEAERSVELADMGLHIRYDWNTWCSDYPLINTRDVIVRQNNERYVIGPVNPQGQRGVIFQQHFTMSYLDQGDIRYAIPIDGGQDQVPASYDAYRQTAPTDAAPIINAKPEIPQERIIRGRTVTFENISY